MLLIQLVVNGLFIALTAFVTKKAIRHEFQGSNKEIVGNVTELNSRISALNDNIMVLRHTRDISELKSNMESLFERIALLDEAANEIRREVVSTMIDKFGSLSSILSTSQNKNIDLESKLGELINQFSLIQEQFINSNSETNSKLVELLNFIKSFEIHINASLFESKEVSKEVVQKIEYLSTSLDAFKPSIDQSINTRSVITDSTVENIATSDL